MPPRPVVLCGPSGVGKSTLLKRLMSEYENCFGFSVSHTTRKPREGEQDGVHYHFVTRDEMTEAIERGEFIEHAVFAGNMYGTSRRAVECVLNSNRICILDIEIEGVKQVKNSDLNPHYIFIRPPSIEDLEARLRARGTETEESLQKRLSVARRELEYGEKKGNFDLVVVNDNLEIAYGQLKSYLSDEISRVIQKS
ncbi:Guanylate kinase [Armadillidium nasatum]|uniref:guanylate kinase n=1 Tax=Armadillidium nasatum TaxID=96803 RepID=A0A5N5SN99_9CRUS|nr:Guanylate kinase [Armadillidium nasatum]